MSDGISIDTSSFAKFARGLKEIDPVLKRELRTDLKAAGEIVAADARSNADWSTRIPGSIKVSVSGNTIKVVANKKKAPHAKAYEHEGKDGTFRHPVFGDRTNWVSEPARVFLAKALIANKQAAVEAARVAVRKALEKVHSYL